MSEEDDYSIFPKLNIKDGIHVLGNYFSTNYDKVKSFSKLELKVDMLEVYLEAQLRINMKYQDLGAEVSFCNLPDPTVEPPPVTFHEKFFEDLVAAYVNKFAENFDQCAIDEILAFQEEIVGNIAKEKSNRDNDEQLHPDFGTLYSVLAKDMAKCF